HFAVTKLITGVCKVPVFGAVNDMLRKGIIGGKLINAFDNGRAAGRVIPWRPRSFSRKFWSKQKTPL
ncbi:MAG: hypothetical protein V1746_08235, partial [bacterium]